LLSNKDGLVKTLILNLTLGRTDAKTPQSEGQCVHRAKNSRQKEILGGVVVSDLQLAAQAIYCI